MWAGVCGSAISDMSEDSGKGGEGGTRQRGQWLGRASGGEGERPHHDPPCELDLEGVVARGLCLRERGLGGATKELRVSRCADEHPFRFPRPPRLRGDAAKREPCICDHVRLYAQCRGG